MAIVIVRGTLLGPHLVIHAATSRLLMPCYCFTV